MGELTLKEIEEIQTELAKEKETKDKEKQTTDRKQAITKILLNLNLYNNQQDYIAEGYAVSNLTLEQVQEQVSDIKKKEDLMKTANQKHFPGVL